MLSAETAAGRYPVESVAMMARIIEEAEASIRDFPRTMPQEQLKVAETVAELVCHASRELHMKLIAVFTHSGFTARLVSRYRPQAPIIAFSPEAETRRRLALIWGVVPKNIRDVRKIDGLADSRRGASAGDIQRAARNAEQRGEETGGGGGIGGGAAESTVSGARSGGGEENDEMGRLPDVSRPQIIDNGKGSNIAYNRED